MQKPLLINPLSLPHAARHQHDVSTLKTPTFLTHSLISTVSMTWGPILATSQMHPHLHLSSLTSMWGPPPHVIETVERVGEGERVGVLEGADVMLMSGCMWERERIN